MFKHPMKNLLILLFIFFFIIPGSIAADTPKEDLTLYKKETKHVLLISSYSPSFKTFFKQIDGIRNDFEAEDILLDIEFMDTKRFYTKDNLNNFYNSITYKLENSQPYDAIIVADDNALHFAVENQESLFHEIPIVFMAINDVDFALDTSNHPYITGVIEKASMTETIALALSLHPNAKNIVALTDSTNTGQGILASYYEEVPNFPNINFMELDLSHLTFDTFTQELQKLDDDDIVLMLSIFSDVDNNKVSFEEGIALAKNNSSQPIYYLYEHGLDEGIIGGKLVSFTEQGRVAASIVKEIFSGTPIQNISIVKESPNQYMFDATILKEFSINKNSLPKDSVIINENLSFFALYKKYIIAAILLFIFQLSMIIALFITSEKHKSAKRALHESQIETLAANEELTAVNEQFYAMNEELSASNEELRSAFEEIQKKESTIHDLVFLDNLTNLHNRRSLFSIIDETITNCKDDHLMAIIFLDIDNFKHINDTYGHDIGDIIIKETGAKLNNYKSEHIHIGRFGGDEFVILLSKVENKEDVSLFTEMLHELFEDKIMVNGKKFFLTISLGVSFYPDNGVNRTDLIKKADLALYKAKTSGKNKSIFYDSNMDSNVERKMRLQVAIREAIRQKEFFLNYQPYISTLTGQVTGFEALIRWVSAEFGYVSPYELITNAEEMGVILEIGNWVLKEACYFAKTLNKDKAEPLSISINISAVQLMHADFYDNVMKVVDETDVNPAYIVLEITETILIQSIEKGMDTLHKLKSHGFGIALDDFGTGYSSFKYFKGLPITTLKIDKTFIDNIVLSDYDQNLINVMIDIAHYKGIEVISEGVETDEQLSLLKASGCDTIQGYLFSKPLHEKDVMKFLEKTNS